MTIYLWKKISKSQRVPLKKFLLTFLIGNSDCEKLSKALSYSHTKKNNF